MKISRNWLSDYINLDGISTEELDAIITKVGLEVEEVYDYSQKLNNIVVGYVKDKKKHPNADKLSVCIVNDGYEDLQVVCGAPNVDKGQKIAFAKVGAIIPNGGFNITKAKLRGEVSNGMICSESELEISDNHDGIMVLDNDLEVGTPIANALGLDDVVFEIAITPNRADALSHLGIARDISAVINRPITKPVIQYNELDEKSEEFAKIIIENEKDCPRYVGKVVKNVTIKESPEWIKKRLTAIGLRPINNVVDITNYVLHETGQPLHAFDLDKLIDKTIIVKNAEEGTKFLTLDSKERTLSANDLMICDGEKSVAIAGIMGGENSEVVSDTKNILIESAFFNPSPIRKTAKRLGLSTDASYRFERGCDPEMPLFAAQRCAQLLQEFAEGQVLNGEIDVYPNKINSKKVKLRFERVKKVLGYFIESERIKNILNALELKVIEENEIELIVDVPAFRHDIEREIDLIEEIARIYGYENIPLLDKINVTLDVKVDQSEYVDNVRDIMLGMGFNEIVTNSLLSDEISSMFGKTIKVLNPSSYEMSNLRPSLLPGLLLTVSRNIKVKENNLKLFEIGKVFNLINHNEIKSFEDFRESEQLTFILSGAANTDEWYSKQRLFDFYDLKGFAELFLEKKSLSNHIKDNYNVESDSIFEYKYEKIYDNKVVGFGGKLNKNVLKEYDINSDAYLFTFDIDYLKEIYIETKKFEELLKYPKMIRDFAIIVEKSINCENITKFIKKNSSNLLQKVQLFDIFESESLGKNKKSIAFTLEYFEKTRTLTEEEVEKDFWGIIEKVKKEFDAELRGK